MNVQPNQLALAGNVAAALAGQAPQVAEELSKVTAAFSAFMEQAKAIQASLTQKVATLEAKCVHLEQQRGQMQQAHAQAGQAHAQQLQALTQQQQVTAAQAQAAAQQAQQANHLLAQTRVELTALTNRYNVHTHGIRMKNGRARCHGPA